MLKSVTKIILGLAILMLAVFARAEQLPMPESRVVLKITGNIENHNIKDEVSGSEVLAMDMAMLEALGGHKVITKTPWTEGETQFEGVLVSVLLEYAGAGSADLVLTGLDGYSADVKNLDFNKYPVIIAYKRDDKPMTVRALGPLWLMFPFDQYPELLNETNKSRAVWQLVDLTVH